MMYRRRKRQYLFAGLLGTIAVINLLFFLILHWPARSEYYQLRDSIVRLRSEVAARTASVKRLELTSTELDRFEQDRRQLYTTYFIQRDKAGYAELLPRLSRIAQETGVRSIRKDYTPEAFPQYGLDSVKIKVPVEGGYSNVVNFVKEMETSDTFFLINSIDVRSGADATGGSGGVELSLDVETFFYR